MSSYTITIKLTEREERRLRQVTGKSGRAAIVAAVNRSLKAPKRSTSPPARGARRFTTAREAMAYLERETGI